MNNHLFIKERSENECSFTFDRRKQFLGRFNFSDKALLIVDEGSAFAYEDISLLEIVELFFKHELEIHGSEYANVKNFKSFICNHFDLGKDNFYFLTKEASLDKDDCLKLIAQKNQSK